MKGSVLEQNFNGGRITAGTLVPWGSKINMVIGGGLQETQIPVPDLVGVSFSEAKDILQKAGITLAAILPNRDVTDTASSYVYRQNPEPLDAEGKPVNIRPGQTMDVWLSRHKQGADSTNRSNITPP